MKGLRTEDNIMVLNTLFEKYVTKNSNKLFVAFVDFNILTVLYENTYLASYYKMELEENFIDC